MTITLTREEAQQVLDALETSTFHLQNHCDVGVDEQLETIEKIQLQTETLRARLAQPEQEPVAWMQTAKRICSVTGVLEDDVLFKTYDNGHGTPLYTAPPQREWQGLTDEEANEVANSVEYNPLAMTVYEYRVAVQKATEAKLKEKNNG